MAFENMTALELHLHLGEETEPDADKPTPRIERPTEDEQPSGLPKPILLLLAAVVVSITLSAIVTLVVKRFKSDDGVD
jgi:hypothetical protein